MKALRAFYNALSADFAYAVRVTLGKHIPNNKRAESVQHISLRLNSYVPHSSIKFMRFVQSVVCCTIRLIFVMDDEKLAAMKNSGFA